MKKWLLMMILLIITASAQSKIYSIKKDAMGCQDQDVFMKIVTIANQGDLYATYKAVLSATVVGECAFF